MTRFDNQLQLKDKLQADQIRSLVVRAPNWFGDTVICLPALRALRRLLPSTHITLVSRPGSADIFIDADFIDEILTYDRSGLQSAAKQIREWKRRRFDLAILFQNAFEAAAIAFLARVPARIGYDTDRRRFLLTHPIPVSSWKNDRHEIFYYLNIVGALERALFGKSDFETIEPEFALSVSDDRKRKARKLMGDHGAQGRPLVLLCPGSVNSRAKRWPPERYAAVADRFGEMGATVALIGSPDELEVSEEVCARTRRHPLVLTGKTSVAEVTELISIADVLITNDTGPAHLGAALGTPTVVIFGPTNPLTTRPFGPAGVMIRHPPDCAPCMLRDCPIDHRCMTAITPEEVFDRALRSMGQSVGTSV